MSDEIQALLKILVPAMAPEEVYLFGSRARADNHIQSDYDLFVIMPDQTPPEKLRLNYVSNLLRHSPIISDVIPCRRSRYGARKNELGTISYDVVREGIQIYARS